MKLSYRLLTLSSIALSIGLGTSAEAAESLALSFELEPIQDADPAANIGTVTPQATVASRVINAAEEDSPLPIPTTAVNPPFAGDTTLPAGVHGGGQALALGDHRSIDATLPAPPPVAFTTSVASQQTIAPTTPRSQINSEPTKLTPVEAIDNLLLGFDLAPRSQTSKPVSNATQEETSSVAAMISRIFQGGVESLVARAVGSAEGTRTPEGHKTPAYFGHVDPGNGVWNLGTFSYQHSAQTPEEADNKQLNRLRAQSITLKQKALAHAINLSLEELLNGIDLANQAPQAALDHEGYIEWLAEARKLGITGSEAIVWARTRSFIDPDTQRWNAPGLGNNIHSIARDQSRRVDAIAQAVDAGDLSPLPLTDTTSQTSLSSALASDNLGTTIDEVLTQTIGALPQNTKALRHLSEDDVAQNQRSTKIGGQPVVFSVDAVIPVDSDNTEPPVTQPSTGPQRDVPETIETPSSQPALVPLNPGTEDNPTQSTTKIEATPLATETPSLQEAFAEPNINFPDELASHPAEPVEHPFPIPNIHFPDHADKLRSKTHPVTSNISQPFN